MIYAVIPFRKGSKRLKDKNILPIANMPLARHTIQQALLAMDDVIISTDYDIPELAKQIPELDRPNVRCHKRMNVSDTQFAGDYLRQIIATYNIDQNDSICLLQPTCPCRRPYDIRQAVKKYETLKGDCLISVYKIGSPGKLYKSLTGEKGRSYTGLTTVFAHEKPLYIRNSSIYIFKVSLFLTRNTIFAEDTILYEMPLSMSIDIDTRDDYNIAKTLIEGGVVEWSPQL